MARNEILPFALTDTGSNLLPQHDYEIDSERYIGNQPGVARSLLVNKALKQSTLVAAAVAEFIASQAGEDAPDVSDTLSVAELAAYLERTVAGMVPAASSGLPEGGEPGQALVMNEAGEAVWQDIKFGTGIPIGTIIAFAGTEAPEGFLSINTEKEMVVPVEAYPALAEAVYCGDELNEEADFFYRTMNADGSVRHAEGRYLVLPAASKYFLRGRDATGEVGAYRYQDWAIENITGSATSFNGNTSGFVTSTSTFTGALRAGERTTHAGTYYGGGLGHVFEFDASLVVRTADETRPMNFPVLWCIKAYEGIVSEGALDVPALINGMLDGMSLVLYPGGNADEPPVINPDERVVIDNPFPGYWVNARVELLINEQWSDPCFIYTSDTPGAKGVKVNQIQPDDKLVIQSAIIAVTAGTSKNNGSAWGLNLQKAPDSAPFRLIVTRSGKIPL